MNGWNTALIDYLRHTKRAQTVPEITEGLRAWPWGVKLSHSTVYGWLVHQTDRGLVKCTRSSKAYRYRWQPEKDLAWPPWKG